MDETKYFNFNESKRTVTGVVITATHPILGPLFWQFSDESSVGGPNYYSITTDIRHALLLNYNWRETFDFKYHGNHVRMVIGQQSWQGMIETEEGSWLHVELVDDLASLQAHSMQSPEEFLEWLRKAEWVDLGGQQRNQVLIDHGYAYTWEDEEG